MHSQPKKSVPTERIGRYEVLRKIATGGMAELFLCKQVGMEGFEKVVAVKRILSHLAYDEEFTDMFRDEARIAAKLSHPNIVQIYDFGKSGDTYFIAMEYIPGRNLSSIAKKLRQKNQGYPPAFLARCMAQACEGLHYAHTRQDLDGKPLGIIHRDVSPQNIILGFPGSVKLVDFGIAKAATKLAHTRAGVLKGKYAYMSPEQIKGEEIDPRSDLFAVGIVLYELLCRRRPFEKENSIQTLKSIVQEKHVDCRVYNPDIPDALAAIIDKALAKKRDERFSSAQEVQIALEDYVAASGTRANNITIGQWVTDLFADELSKEKGGTVVLKGVGEVVLPEVVEARDPSNQGSAPTPSPSQTPLDEPSPRADSLSLPSAQQPSVMPAPAGKVRGGGSVDARPPIPAPSTRHSTERARPAKEADEPGRHYDEGVIARPGGAKADDGQFSDHATFIAPPNFNEKGAPAREDSRGTEESSPAQGRSQDDTAQGRPLYEEGERAGIGRGQKADAYDDGKTEFASNQKPMPDPVEDLAPPPPPPPAKKVEPPKKAEAAKKPELGKKPARVKSRDADDPMPPSAPSRISPPRVDTDATLPPNSVDLRLLRERTGSEGGTATGVPNPNAGRRFPEDDPGDSGEKIPTIGDPGAKAAEQGRAVDLDIELELPRGVNRNQDVDQDSRTVAGSNKDYTEGGLAVPVHGYDEEKDRPKPAAAPEPPREKLGALKLAKVAAVPRGGVKERVDHEELTMPPSGKLDDDGGYQPVVKSSPRTDSLPPLTSEARDAIDEMPRPENHKPPRKTGSSTHPTEQEPLLSPGGPSMLGTPKQPVISAAKVPQPMNAPSPLSSIGSTRVPAANVSLSDMLIDAGGGDDGSGHGLVVNRASGGPPASVRPGGPVQSVRPGDARAAAPRGASMSKAGGASRAIKETSRGPGGSILPPSPTGPALNLDPYGQPRPQDAPHGASLVAGMGTPVARPLVAPGAPGMVMPQTLPPSAIPELPRARFSKIQTLLIAVCFVALGALGAVVYYYLTRGPTLEITTVPPGAEIYLDDHLLPRRTPLKVDKVVPGQVYKVRVVLQGHKELTRVVPMPATRQPAKVNFVLEVAEPAPAPAPAPAPKEEAPAPAPTP